MRQITDLNDDCIWHATAVPAPSLPRLEDDVEAEIAIVGAGYTGLTTALRLAERGHEPVVVEAEQAGFGGSGRNLGHCTPTLHYWPYAKLKKMYGEEYAKRFIRLQTGAADQVFSLIEQYQIECEAVRNGILRTAASHRHLKGLRAQKEFYESHGLRGHMLDTAEAESLSGSPRFHGGWLMEGAGHLNPLGYARGLARAAVSRGAKVHVQSAVEAVERDGSKWRLRTSAGSVLAGRVLMATGAYTVGPPWPGLNTAFDLVPVAGLASAPLDPKYRDLVLKGDHSLVDTHGDPILYKWTPNNRLISTVFFSGAMGNDPDATRDYMTRKTKWVFPQIEDITWEHYWFGLLDGQYRTIPRIFELDDNVYSCLGYSGRGVPTGTAMGGVLADLLEGKDPKDLSLPVERFQKVTPGLAAMLSLHMQWSRFRDRVRHRLDGTRDLPPVI